jgi:hypothetical protein
VENVAVGAEAGITFEGETLEVGVLLEAVDELVERWCVSQKLESGDSFGSIIRIRVNRGVFC